MQKQSQLPLPTPTKIKLLSKILSRKEKFILYLAVVVLIASLVTWAISYFLSSTEKVPTFGGEITEGMVGQPMYINPILSQSNEIDSSLSRLIFSSLMTYDSQGNLVNDLAESYEVSSDGKKYTFKIKSGIKWHDKTDLTAKDIAFTLKLIQDQAFKSPLRGNFQDVKVETIDDQTIAFVLDEPYSPFLNKLTFGILPAHIFEEMGADKFLISDFNLKPIGSGPFEFVSLKQDEDGNILSMQLEANPDYFAGRPFLDKIDINFYPEENEMIEAYNKKEIDSFGLLSYQKIEEFKNKKDTSLVISNTPRYFAIFLNETKSLPLADKNVRKALSLLTNRDEIVKEVFGEGAVPVYSPILPHFENFQSITKENIQEYQYNSEKAEKILDEAGWKKEADGIRKKDGNVFEITLITTDRSDLIKVSELVKKRWEEFGIKVNIQALSFNDVKQNFIRPREYQAIIIGQEYLGNDPDPYFFFHSSGKKDPGRNISLFDNEEADKLLIEARQTQEAEKRKELYRKFEEIFFQENPAIFLFSPNYVYVASSKIKGIDNQKLINSSFRFNHINKWYLKTKRQKKQS